MSDCKPQDNPSIMIVTDCVPGGTPRMVISIEKSLNKLLNIQEELDKPLGEVLAAYCLIMTNKVNAFPDLNEEDPKDIQYVLDKSDIFKGIKTLEELGREKADDLFDKPIPEELDEFINYDKIGEYALKEITNGLYNINGEYIWIIYYP